MYVITCVWEAVAEKVPYTMSAQKLSDSLKEAIIDAFDRIDVDKTCRLSSDGVRSVLQLVGQNPTKAELNIYFKQLGADSVDRNSICDFIEKFVPIKSQEKINNEIAEAFAKFDTNDNFVISKADFKEILTKIGDEPLTEAEVNTIMECLDQNSDHLNVSDLSKLLKDWVNI